MSEAVILFIATTVLGVFWKWVSSLKENSQENSKKIETINTTIIDLKTEIYRDYQSKEDAHKDHKHLLEVLKEIKGDIKEVGNKLDKKVDKTYTSTG